MYPIATVPDATTRGVLDGATFADAFSVDVDEIGLGSRTAAERAFGAAPPWITGLLAVRNFVVRPLGLKGTEVTGLKVVKRIGIFPCVSESPDRIVLGLNDAHLDFRVIVDVASITEHRQRVTATTVVKPHNVFGRAYLATIMPFHKRIVPAMLAQVVKS